MAAENPESGSDERFSPESKVGLFVLAGLAVLMTSILMLGDIHFRPQKQVYAIFRNIEGITDKSPIKISGVEIGTVKKVELVNDHARITMGLRRDLRMYKNARVRIRSTGIIGSKFVALDPGRLVPGSPEGDQRLRDGDSIVGEDVLSMDELMERVAKSLDEFTGHGKTGENFSVTMANLRSITDSLNVALGQQRRAMVDIVRNVQDLTAHAKSVAAHLDDILTSSKDEIKTAIHNLKDTLDKTSGILGGLQRGEGTLGALLSDKKTGEEVKETVSNLKQASESAKQVLNRFTKVRAFWIVQGRRDFKAAAYHGDFGMRFEPRENKFYEVMGQNLSTKGSTRTSDKDYTRTNTVTALMGYNWGTFTGAVGVIQSRAGVEGRYRPFQNTEMPGLNRLELMAQGFDFGRDAVLNGRHFDSPNYTAGARVKVNQWMTAGLQSEDIGETSNLNGVVNVSFEDKDIAYLLGFVSFAR
jgi:phospholipid/cholesterol/gamma-HCH transport system substrate-binding protein